MKSNFALSLSFEGIRLLHRAAGGWRLVGDVSLDAADMPGDLERLRQDALLLEPSGLRTKLLLPNDQIKYLTLETEGLSDAERLDAAKAALDGATPYAVADLAFDICADGSQTHVAAVAKETLAEAEGFAVEYNFNPVCFTAIPGEQPYLGAPFFGEAAGAAALLDGEAFVHDDIAVVVVGKAEIPAPIVVEAEPEPKPEPTNAAAEPDSPEKLPEPAPAQNVEKVATPKEQPATETEAQPTSMDVEKTALPEDVPAIKQPAPPLPAEEPAIKATVGDEKPEVRDTTPPPPSKTPQPPAKDKVPAPVAPIAAEPPANDAVPSAGFASRRAAPAKAGPTRQEPALHASATSAQHNAAPPVAANYGDVVIPPRAPEVAPEPVAAPAKKSLGSGFLSRRKSKTADKPTPKVKAKPTGKKATAGTSEAERMTVFGARSSEVGGKPKFLGLMLTAALLVFLAGVAAWASVFLDDGISLSRFFGDRSKPEFSTVPPQQAPKENDEIITASLDPALSPEDSAVLDALRVPVTPPLADLSQAELEAKYAATGIWPRAPQVPPEPASLINIDDLYLTSIDPISPSADAIALPSPNSFSTDATLAAVSSPVAAGTQFALDSRGLVIPTAQGTLSPDGIVVYLGKPAVVPPTMPTRFQTVPEDTATRSALAAQRPQTRPSTLAETHERAKLDGLTRSELATLRPALRPQSIQQLVAALAAAKVAEETKQIETDAAVTAALAPTPAIENATKFAVKASMRPDTRPRNFARIVRRAVRATPPKEKKVASVASVAPRTVKPKIPSSASVARQATVKNAINLRKVNLIGVYGKPSSRRALIRLSNGRYKKVTVGDRIDGGRVSAIGQSELRYTKGGRNVVLKMPRG